MEKKIKTILFVDDDKDAVIPLITAVKEQGYKTILSQTGSDGIDQAILAKPDLIVLDVMLPDYNGYQICRKLKEKPDLKNIPVIMLTGKTKDDFWGVEAGIDVYINKPYNVKNTLEHINDLLNEMN